TRVWPYESLQSLKQSVNIVDADFLGLHETVLGKNIGDIFSEVSEIENDAINIDFASRLKSGSPRVLVSWTGIAGDCGFRSPLFLYELQGMSYQHFIKTEDSYRSMLESRQILRTPAYLTVTPGGFCQSTALAFDNRELLPPFPPVLRGEDWIFSKLLSTLSPHSLTAY